MIRQLAHVCIYSSDLAQTEAFYCDLLGLKVKFRFLKDGALFGYYFEVAPGQFIEVFRRQDASHGTPPIGHFCLEVADLRALRQRILDAGVTVTEPKLGADRSWQMWVKDPDGTSIEFHEYTAESSQHSGADCIVTW